MRNLRKHLAILLAVLMIVTIMPNSAFAAGENIGGAVDELDQVLDAMPNAVISPSSISIMPLAVGLPAYVNNGGWDLFPAWDVYNIFGNGAGRVSSNPIPFAAGHAAITLVAGGPGSIILTQPIVLTQLPVVSAVSYDTWAFPHVYVYENPGTSFNSNSSMITIPSGSHTLSNITVSAATSKWAFDVYGNLTLGNATSSYTNQGVTIDGGLRLREGGSITINGVLNAGAPIELSLLDASGNPTSGLVLTVNDTSVTAARFTSADPAFPVNVVGNQVYLGTAPTSAVGIPAYVNSGAWDLIPIWDFSNASGTGRVLSSPTAFAAGHAACTWLNALGWPQRPDTIVLTQPITLATLLIGSAVSYDTWAFPSVTIVENPGSSSFGSTSAMITIPTGSHIISNFKIVADTSLYAFDVSGDLILGNTSTSSFNEGISIEGGLQLRAGGSITVNGVFNNGPVIPLSLLDASGNPTIGLVLTVYDTAVTASRFSSVQPGLTVEIIGNGVYLTGQQELTPNGVLDYLLNAITGLVPNATYIVDGVTYIADASGIIVMPTDFVPNSVISIIKVGAIPSLNSPAQTITVPSRPAFPTPGAVNVAYGGPGVGLILGLDPTMELRVVGTSTWESPSNGFFHIGLSSSSYEIRVCATSTSLASESIIRDTP